MNLVREYRERVSSVEKKDLRSFGLVFGCLSILFFGWILHWLNPEFPKWRYGLLGMPFLFFAAVYPRALLPVFKAATALGLILGRINNFLLLTLLFWLVFTPYGIFIRNFTKKLGLSFSKIPPRDSFKIYRKDKINPDQMEKPF